MRFHYEYDILSICQPFFFSFFFLSDNSFFLSTFTWGTNQALDVCKRMIIKRISTDENSHSLMKTRMRYSYVVIFFLVQVFTCGYGDDNSDSIHIEYQVRLAIPTEYTSGFIGRAYLMETDQKEPNFRTAVSVEAINEKYSCSLDVFLGNVKVWSSGHLSPFYTTDKCMLDFTESGDLQLKGQEDRVGWRSGTSGQGVKVYNL